MIITRQRFSLTGKARGACQHDPFAAQAGDDSVLTPRGYLVRLPAVLDVVTNEVHRATIEMFLYEPQAEALKAKPLMFAVGFSVDREGIELWLMHGNFRERPTGWSEAFDEIGLSGSYDGLRGLAAMQAIALHLGGRKPRHGERGPGKKNQAARDLLLAAVLLRMSRGASRQRAICEALAEYESIVPWTFDTAEASLLQVLKRFLRNSRSFVPSPPALP